MCGRCSCWAILALVCLIVALIVDVIGFSSMYWMTFEQNTQRNRVGLFQMETCLGDTCDTGDVDDSLKDSNFRATQVLEVILLILIILGIICLIIYLVVEVLTTNCMAWIIISMCFVAALFGFIGMILWLMAVEDPYIIGYSMPVTVIAAILALIAGFLLFPDVIDRGQQGPIYPEM